MSCADPMDKGYYISASSITVKGTDARIFVILMKRYCVRFINIKPLS